MTAQTDHAATWLKQAGTDARAASAVLARASDATRNAALTEAAARIRGAADTILAANEVDLAASQSTSAFRDRLTLTPARIEAMAAGLEDVAALPDPLARTLAEWQRPNGLRFRRIATPIGVVGMIYESRPNVGADAAGAVPEGGQRRHPARRVGKPAQRAGDPRRDRRRPGGGRAAGGLRADRARCRPRACRRHAGGCRARSTSSSRAAAARWWSGCSVTRGCPCWRMRKGLNHLFVHAAADPSMACALLVNSKLRRTGVCGATETLLVDAARR